MSTLHYTSEQNTAFAEYFLAAGVNMNKLANVCLGNFALATWFAMYLKQEQERTYSGMYMRELQAADVSWPPLVAAINNDVRAQQWLIEQAEKWAVIADVVKPSQPASTSETLSAARIKHATDEPAVAATSKRLVYGLALFEAMMTHNDRAQQCVLRGEMSQATDELQAQQLLGAILRRDILRTKQQEQMLSERRKRPAQGTYAATNQKILDDSYTECSRLLARYCASHAHLPEESLLSNLADDDEPVGELPVK